MTIIIRNTPNPIIKVKDGFSMPVITGIFGGTPYSNSQNLINGGVA